MPSQGAHGRGEHHSNVRCGNGALSLLGSGRGEFANSLGKQDGEVNPRGHWDKTYLSRDNSGRVILLQFK